MFIKWQYSTNTYTQGGNKMGNVIEAMTREQWEEYYNSEWRAEARKRQNYWNRKHAAEKEKRRYFCNQKLLGIIITIISLLPFLITGNLTYLFPGSIGAIIGIGMVLTKKMVIVNDYWMEHGGADQWK